MERQLQRDLEILTAIDEGEPLTQRALAQRLGVALGLTNLYLRRLATKGYIKIAEFPHRAAPRKRLRYLLTAKGIAEKTRLTYEHMSYALNLYRRARQRLREALAPLPGAGATRVVLYGDGEAAELAYLTLRELGLEPLGIYTRDGGGGDAQGRFLGFEVRRLKELPGLAVDRVVVATFERTAERVAELAAAGIPAEKIVTLRGLDTPAQRARRS